MLFQIVMKNVNKILKISLSLNLGITLYNNNNNTDDELVEEIKN